MRKQILINVEETDIRVAAMEDGVLVEMFVENLESRTKVGNIYKGRIESIVPGLKAAFVNIGCEKNAFLHFADILQEYDLPHRGRPERLRPSKLEDANTDETIEEDDEFAAPTLSDDEAMELMEEEDEEEPLPKKVKRPSPRSKQLHVGDELLVQVTKEEINTKGPRITSYISLPGRFLVLMPCSDRGGGVSRRIDDTTERRRLRQILRNIEAGEGSVIIRTAGIDQSEEEILQDVDQLRKTWGSIQRTASRVSAPARVYDDQEILHRVVRDYFTEDIDEILIDNKDSMRKLITSTQDMVPSLVNRVIYYDSPTNIFDTFEVETQFQKALKRSVGMRSGGAIVIDETEALTAIDVNSGKFVGQGDQDQVILKTNLDACRAVARQLRLRDLGGLIVIDFIDMNQRDHELQVLREFKRCLRGDRAKYTTSDFSTFGLVEMTRKRVRKSLARAFFTPCPYCDGSGHIISPPQLWKQLKYDLLAKLESKPKAESVDITVHCDLKTYLQDNVLEALTNIAQEYDIKLNIISKYDYHHERYDIVKHSKSSNDNSKPSRRGGTGRRRKPAEKKLESTPSGNDNAPTE